MTTCKTCGAAVLWVTMTSGKAMPLDASPHPEGNIVLVRLGEVVVGKVLSKDDLREMQATEHPLYVSHFATCPQGKQHRRAP